MSDPSLCRSLLRVYLLGGGISTSLEEAGKAVSVALLRAVFFADPDTVFFGDVLVGVVLFPFVCALVSSCLDMGRKSRSMCPRRSRKHFFRLSFEGRLKNWYNEYTT